MSAIEWTYDGRRIYLDILVLRAAPAADLTMLRVRALVDTGANVSGIGATIAHTLGLPPLGKRPIITANGIRQAERYAFRIGIPGILDSSLPYIFDDLLGFSLGSDGLDAVLGMDVLSRCDFSIRRDLSCRLVV